MPDSIVALRRLGVELRPGWDSGFVEFDFPMGAPPLPPTFQTGSHKGCAGRFCTIS